MIYALYAASAKRWEILKTHVRLSLQPLCETAWEAKVENVNTV
jgi:hypothetical protein